MKIGENSCVQKKPHIARWVESISDNGCSWENELRVNESLTALNKIYDLRESNEESVGN